MEHDDKIGIFYNFVSTSQSSWREKFDATIIKHNNGTPIDKDKFGAVYILKLILQLFILTVDLAKESVSLSEPSQKKSIAIQLSPETLKKRESTVIKSQILCLSESENYFRSQNNAVATCEAFKSVSGDNELIYKKINLKFEPLIKKLKNIEQIKISPREGQNFLSLPGRELLEEYKIINHIETKESEVSKELQSGIICLGDNTFKGKRQKSFFSTDEELQYLVLVIIGPPRSGKTTLISNISKDTVSNRECTIIFDFCGNCELTNEVGSLFENKLVIDCSDYNMLQGLGYNEVKKSDDVFAQYKNAKMQTMQLITLIDSITTSDKEEMSVRMDRFLEAASVVVFIQNGNINDVFKCLVDCVFRKKIIESTPLNQLENTQEYIDSLKELDDEKKGTKIHLVVGILDRVSKLKQNAYLELMLKKDCENNFDLLEEINKNQLICLKMPESMFATEREKDVYCTYWMTKIWLSLQLRKADNNIKTKVNIIVDELYQVPSCQDFIRSKLSQMPKFRGKIIISCHYLGQIPIIRNELKAANSSYMLISGCDKDNYKELKDELYPYTVEDVLNLKRYHSLNLIKYEGGYAKFITKLPPPI